MIGSRQTRGDAEGATGRKWTGGARGEGHAIILRSGPGAGGAAVSATKPVAGVGPGRPGRAPGSDPTSVLQGIGPIFGPETEFIEDRFHELGNQLGRFVGMEERLSKMVQGANRLVQMVKQITQQQKQILNSLTQKDGRRLVGRGTRGAHKSLLHEAVMNAVMGLGSHCTEIEEKIEEKIRIEEQCVKAVLTRTNAEETEPDIVLEPKPGPPSRSLRGMPTNGRILERLIISHRLWRIVPFNFEIYPGIRMNVPPGKLNWKTTYNEYRTFKITEDRLAIPYVGMDDENINPPQLSFNSYDQTSGVTRMTLRGRVRVFQTTDIKPDMSEQTRTLIGYPLNPTGRSGLHGRGLLPHWGPNHAVHIALTRLHPDGLVRAGLPVIQVAVLYRNQNYCLPWYLLDHRADCEFHECTPNVVRAFITRRLYHVIEDKTEAKNALGALKSADMSLVYTGFLQDHLNADHAWIETIFMNIQQNPELVLPAQFLQVFLENDHTEQVVWIDVCRQLGMRVSHDELLYRLAIHRKVFYDESISAEDYQ
ncbi:unnamed protein product [Echinostoma caproni]|uniref:RING-type domain-containing protein n=1 Tax=Echinostoma caproni TaxID=27848 RepID=A0A183ABQ5_9TREM|nr:unnamed protein product [Echinostoma caproni]